MYNVYPIERWRTRTRGPILYIAIYIVYRLGGMHHASRLAHRPVQGRGGPTTRAPGFDVPGGAMSTAATTPFLPGPADALKQCTGAGPIEASPDPKSSWCRDHAVAWAAGRAMRVSTHPGDAGQCSGLFGAQRAAGLAWCGTTSPGLAGRKPHLRGLSLGVLNTATHWIPGTPADHPGTRHVSAPAAHRFAALSNNPCPHQLGKDCHD